MDSQARGLNWLNEAFPDLSDGHDVFPTQAGG
jgi:hypothetical protein